MKVDGANDPLPISSDSRFSLLFDSASSTYTLQIKDIQEADAGIYQCQVIIALTNKITADVELLVRRPPIIADNSTTDIVVCEGQPVQLECYANGFPMPSISWRREYNAILPTGGSIFRSALPNRSLRTIKKPISFLFVMRC
jgi:neuronal growth regulator 1